MVDTLTRSLVFVGLVALAFVPLERAFPIREEGARRGLATDLAFATFGRVATKLLLVFGVGRLLDVADAHAWENGPWNAVESVSARTLVTVGLGLLLFELGGYAYHRLAHRVPFLWRLHEVHHSAETMDWLAGSRLHLVDVAVTRGLTYVPAYVLGFGEGPLFAYVAWVSIQATLIHANVRFEFGPLRWWLATPQFHHWHHAADAEGIDKNFAVHLPLLDWLFGTLHLPASRWPERYGLSSGERPPEGYCRQFWYPFRRRRQTPPDSSA